MSNQTTIIITEGDKNTIITSLTTDTTKIIELHPLPTVEIIQVSTTSGGGIGASGISGYSGYSGTNGTVGMSGYSGFSGWSGYSGYSGMQGTGVSGYSGYSGQVPSITSTQIAFGDGSNHLTSSPNLIWDEVNKILSIKKQGLSESTFLNGAVTGLKVQTDTLNERSFFAIVPNGNSNLADIWLFEGADVNTNFSAMAWGFELASQYWGWNNVAGGSKAVKPFYFNATGGATSATANLRIETNGTIIITSLKTGSTPPTTSGTIKQVVTDANGLLSDIPITNPNGLLSIYQRNMQNFI